MAEPRRAAALGDLREGEVLGVEVDGHGIVLFLADGVPHAMSDTCPHAECPLSEYGVIEGQELECSCHGSRFDINTGANTAPPADSPLSVYAVQVSGEDVMVDLG